MVAIAHTRSAPDWAARSPENRLQVIAREVSERLAGLSTIFYALAFATMSKGGIDHEQEVYFAVALKDLSAALATAHRDAWAAAVAADEPSIARQTKRRAVKRPKAKA